MIERVFVAGIPAPQGSTKAFVDKAGKAHVTSDNPRMRPWRELVSAIVRSHVGPDVAIPTGPVVVFAEFVMPRRAADMTLRIEEWSPAHVVKPDLDKLGRALLDSLTGIVYRDDAQVVRLVSAKRYAALRLDGTLEQPGMHLGWLALPQEPRPAAQRRRGRAGSASPV
jgi:Holliday junction resolvase RusA-like endonuclease